MSQDELAVMDGGKCILQLRGVRPFPFGQVRHYQSTPISSTLPTRMSEDTLLTLKHSCLQG